MMTWVLAIEKELRASDLDSNQNRLLIHRSDARERLLPLLRPPELALVNGGSGIKVDITTCNGSSTFEVTFKYWPSSKGYLFNGNGWGQLLEQYRDKFKEGTVLRFFAQHRGKENIKFRLIMIVASNKETMDAADVLVSMKHPYLSVV
ncbi:hypothetical protein HPP92_022528 [Vanilla planifolia]|uniref:TF-B3 domain-containing protein n=1 Tax=Vanilla planifolia TaxID=51239 RepID=A0A835PNQ0_VANPL|nr:hypothetical protein HPP92_022528 [Vanilla planifolia]